MSRKKQKRFIVRSSFPGTPLRWYLLLWLCLIYLVGIFGETTFLHSFRPCAQGLCPIVIASDNWLSSPAMWTFTLLMGLLCILLWLSMSGNWKFGRSWISFFVQGILVLSIGLLPEQQQLYVALSLYLALILGALAVFQHARPVMLIGGYYGLLFVMNLALSLWQNMGGMSRKLLDQAPLNGPLLGTVLGVSANSLALLLFATGYLVMYVQQLRSHAQLETAHAELQASATRIETLIVMTERQRMARELHDTLVQNLAGLIRQLDVATSLLANQRTERAQAILQESSASARAALVEARCAIGDLRAEIPPVAALGQVVQEDIDRFSSATGIVCETDLAALALAQSSHCEQVVRAISEGLTNVARHAQAKHAWVRASQVKDALLVEIGDDGIGFSTDAIIQAGHYGLVGLRERARLAQGRLEVNSVPGQGTVLLLHLPLAGEEG